MIIKKTPEEIEAMKEAGRVSAKVLREVGARIKPGVTTLDLDKYAEMLIRLEGGIPTFKGYGGFPGSLCASINDQIVHGIPSDKVILQEGDICSIDVGATVNGWVGDNAWTFPVGKISPEKQELLKVTEESMWAAIDAARPGNHLGDVGHACQSVAEAHGFGVVREYVGHGVGHVMHEDPNVPNYGHAHRGIKLEEGMVIAIEPMINAGTYKTRQGNDGWLVLTRDGKPSAHFEKTIAITADGPLPLTVEPDHRRPVSD
ncbi:MAG: type I methionyl aminopeptidase [Eggerthellaceae bacterium]|jgi:methionyl aminopeptidase|nr:type I methionyl aminopeptidase [Eggerthellaceae bacterium]